MQAASTIRKKKPRLRAIIAVDFSARSAKFKSMGKGSALLALKQER
jgi:hypothetical protein